LDAYAHKLLGQPSDLGILTDNLPVEAGTRDSAFASKDDKERLARFQPAPFAFFVAVDPLDLAVERLRWNLVGFRTT
jgi:hypothetical protein